MASKWTSEEAPEDAAGAKAALKMNQKKEEDNEKEDDAAPRRKTGGWGLDGATNAGPTDAPAEAKPGRRRPPPPSSDEVGRRNRHFLDDDNNVEQIIDIPDLDETEGGGEEDITTKVAQAPRDTAKKVQSMRELDQDIQYTLPSSSGGLDLSLLTAALCPQGSIQEEDVTWEFDALLQEVGQELQAELDEDEKAKAEEGAPTPDTSSTITDRSAKKQSVVAA